LRKSALRKGLQGEPTRFAGAGGADAGGEVIGIPGNDRLALPGSRQWRANPTGREVLLQDFQRV